MVLKIITTLLLFCLYAHSACGVILIQRAGGVCSTPDESPLGGDELNEGFIGTTYDGGYETDGWSETKDGAATLNPNYTLTGDIPEYSCEEGLYIHVPTSSGATRVVWSFASELSLPVDLYVEFNAASITLPVNDDKMDFIPIWNGAWTSAVEIRFRRDSVEGLTIRANSAVDSDLIPVSTGTWHTLQVHLDATAASSYIKLNSTQEPFTRNGDGVQHFYVGAAVLDTDEALTIQIGRIWVTTP